MFFSSTKQGIVTHLTLFSLLVSPALAEPNPRVTYHGAPKPLDPEAVTADWPRFLGPSDDGVSPETHLLAEFPEDGPTKVWEMTKGTGYTSPVIVDGRLVFFDRRDDEEVIDCLDPETGELLWSRSYPVRYSDRYGFLDGPRASAVIDSGKVYTMGVTNILTCLDLTTGTQIWQRDLAAEFTIAPYFFGFGSCPIVFEGKLITSLGTDNDESVIAFDQNTGETLWTTRHEWNASYASPVICELQGAPRLLVFQGGDSDPPTGGLLCIDPETGALLDDFSWRPDKYESVNGSTPIAVGGNRVYLSSSYQLGGVLLELTPDLTWEKIWTAPEFGHHWSTPLHLDGNLYGFPGRNEPDAFLASYSVETGQKNWAADPEWTIQLESGRDYKMRYFRGNLLHADGRSYALGELGSLGIFDFKPEKISELDRTQLFVARSTWSLPVLHRGLLYVSQHESAVDGSPPRLICYDLRR